MIPPRLALLGCLMLLAACLVGGGAARAAALYKTLPAFCRVAGVIKPTSESTIKFETWMPLSGWNQRFQGGGRVGGGLAKLAQRPQRGARGARRADRGDQPASSTTRSAGS